MERCVLEPTGGSGCGGSYWFDRSVIILSKILLPCVGKSTTWWRDNCS